MIKNSNAEKMKEKTEKKPAKYIKDPKAKAYIMPYNAGVFEAKIIHFVYSYILLNPFIEIRNFKYNNDDTRDEINEAYREMINFLTTVINDTKITYTYCWIYELLQ